LQRQSHGLTVLGVAGVSNGSMVMYVPPAAVLHRADRPRPAASKLDDETQAMLFKEDWDGFAAVRSVPQPHAAISSTCCDPLRRRYSAWARILNTI
jgi:hypothetical protein